MKSFCLICIAMLLFVTSATAALAAPRGEVSAAELKKIEAALPAEAPAKPAKPRKILIFDKTEGFHHDSIPCGDKAFELMGEKTGAYTATIAHDMDVFTPENLAKYDAVLFESTTQLKFSDPAQRKALLDFVKGGKGFIGIHAASDNFPTWPEAVEMIGGQFNGHPWTAGGTWAVKVDDPDHVLNKSFDGKGFLIKDEIYQIKGPYSRDTHRVLLSMDMSKERNLGPLKGKKKGEAWSGREDDDHAIAWIKRYGDGRVFYCSLGHNKEIYWNPAVLAHYLAGIQWALGDLQADETPSAKLATPPKAALAPE
jgi:type 1 glutamine amidotransferase